MIPYQFLTLGALRSVSDKFPAYSDRIISGTSPISELLDLALYYTKNGTQCVVLSGEISPTHLLRKTYDRINKMEHDFPGLDKSVFNGLVVHTMPSSSIVSPEYCETLLDMCRGQGRNPSILLADSLDTSDPNALHRLRKYACIRGIAIIYAKQLPRNVIG